MAGIDVKTVPRKQKLSVLTKLEIKQNKEHVKGEEADLTITAYYDNGFSRNVTKEAVLTGFHKIKEDQTFTITHSENNHTITEDFKLIAKKAEVVPDKKQESKKEEKDKTLAKTRDNTQLVVFAIFFLLYGIYLLRRMKKS